MIRALLLCAALCFLVRGFCVRGFAAQSSGAHFEQDTDTDLMRAVESAPEEQLLGALQAAHARFIERIDAFELVPAEDLMRAMHARSHAGWSAESLSLLLGRADRFDEARLVLDEQLARTDPASPEHGALMQARALASLGAGHEARARRELGAALVHGSPDAAVVLARLALSSGQPERARVVARALLGHDPAPSWALRAWGISMLQPSEDPLSSPR